MSLMKEDALRPVPGLARTDQIRIKAFLQGAVYCWCANRPDEWFTLRELLGEPAQWGESTPLRALIVKHLMTKPREVALTAAARDGACILQEAMFEDARLFESMQDAVARKYRWVRGW